MKKNIFSLGVLAAAAIALAGCAKTETNVPEVKGTGIPFEFTATSAVTKTTNDGLDTYWKAGDQVNLFHAELGGTAITYVSDGAFTAATDGAEVKFTGTLAEGFDPEGTYNWYAFYPYTSQITTPANHNKGWVTVGSEANSSQTQKGNGNMDHIAGSNYPIAGIVEKISGSKKLSITMTHLTSLIEVAVTNGTSDPITVTDISFTGTEDIVGTYYIDFASSPIVFTPSGSKYITNTAKLIVEDGTPIAAGDKAYFYLAVKPFTAPAGEKLTLKVTTAEHGAQEVEKTLTADAAFEAGVENFLNFNYTKEDALPVLSLPFEDSMSWATADEDGLEELTEEVFPTTKEGVVLYSSMTKCYTGAEGLKFGSNSARGEITTSNIDLSSPYTIIISAKQWGTDESTLQVLVDDEEVSANEVLYNEFLEYVYKPTVGTASSKVTIKVNGKRGYINNIRIISGTSYTAKPLIHITSVPSEFAAEGGNGEIGYEILNPASGSVAAEAGASWVSSLDYSEDNVISFAVAANTGEFRTQNVTLSYPGADDVLVPVQQSAYVAPGSEKEYTFTISPADFNSTSYAANNVEHTSKATATDGSEIDIVWRSNQVMLNSGDMQWQKNNGYIYNVTSLGSVKDVSITSSTGSFTTSINSSANPTTDAGAGAFFKVAVGNATGKTQSIVVTFKK